MSEGAIECTYVDVQMSRMMTRRRDWKLKIAVCDSETARVSDESLELNNFGLYASASAWGLEILAALLCLRWKKVHGGITYHLGRNLLSGPPNVKRSRHGKMNVRRTLSERATGGREI
jgi:hypothetical protein